MVDQSNLRSKYLLDGYIIVKSVFKKEHISNLRDKMIDLSYNNPETEEILLFEDVQNLILNKKLIQIIKEILGTDEILYFGDSGIVNHVEPFKNRNGYHNDARGEVKDIPYKEEYPIVRVGIYFENYKDFSGGLKIKKKSHKYFIFNYRRIFADLIKIAQILFTKTRYTLSSLKLGKSVNLELEEGDIVIWNLRTHHSGTSRRLKFFRNVCLQPFIEKLLPLWFFLPTQYSKNRCSIFSTFSKNDLKNKNIKGYIDKKINPNKLNKIKLNSNLLNKMSENSCFLPESVS